MLLIEAKCNQCGELKKVNGHTFDGICNDCKTKDEKNYKNQYLKNLQTLSTKERLARIESELYDLSKRLDETEGFASMLRPGGKYRRVEFEYV